MVSERALQMRAATSFQVPHFDTGQLMEIQAIRAELEGRAAFEAAGRITPKELDQLREIHAKFIAAASKDPAKASNLNRDFHFALLSMSRMPLLVGMCENMWTLIGPVLRVFHIRMPVREISSDEHKHHELLDALSAGDRERSRKAIQEDIYWADDLILQVGEELSKNSSAS